MPILKFSFLESFSGVTLWTTSLLKGYGISMRLYLFELTGYTILENIIISTDTTSLVMLSKSIRLISKFSANSSAWSVNRPVMAIATAFTPSS